MRKHAGSWAVRIGAKEILANGKSLREPFNQLSRQDFEAYVRATYDIDYRRALDWMNAARRFADCPQLIEDLTEAVIRRLAAPSLNMEDVEYIISQIRTKAIASDYRTVEQAIRSLKTIKLLQEESVILASGSTSLSQDIRLPQRFLDEMEEHKQILEANKLRMEEDLAAVRRQKENILRQISGFEEKEKQLQAEISELDIQIQTLAPVLKLYERDFKAK